MKSLGKYKAQVIILVIILAIFNPYTRAFFKSVLLISEIFPGSSVKPLGIFTKEPILKEVVYKSGGKEIFADLWSPNDRRKHPGAVLHLGLDIDRKDPRVQMFAKSLARSGIIVLAPNIPSISNRRLTRETPRELEDSFKYLTSLNLVDKKKTGFMGLCVAGAPTLIAAQSKDLKNKVAYLITINPYYDLSSLYKEITIRKINGEIWIPHFKTVEVFNRETIFQVDDEKDKETLSKLLINIDQERLSRGLFDKVDPYKTFNTDEAIEVYLGLTNKDPQKSDSYLKNATKKQKDYLKALSASTYVKDFKPKTFILSEKPNHYLPYTEAEDFAKNIKGSVFEEVNFTVTEPTYRIGFKDGIKSFIFLWKVLSFLGA